MFTGDKSQGFGSQECPTLGQRNTNNSLLIIMTSLEFSGLKMWKLNLHTTDIYAMLFFLIFLLKYCKCDVSLKWNEAVLLPLFFSCFAN